MSKKLTAEQIEDRLRQVEGRYYKGNKQDEYWWRVSGDVHPTDRRLWTMYNNMLNKVKEKEKVSLDKVKHWLGNDWSFDDICETFQDLANGDYKPEQLKEDIENLAELGYTKDNI
tara:strand:+ start:990 stop:1334 length:345 start_codon:yes stop_codon:yes gene_type:complete